MCAHYSGRDLAVPPRIRAQLHGFKPTSGTEAKLLFDSLRDQWDALVGFAADAAAELEHGSRFVVLKDVAFARETPVVRDAALVALGAALGEVIGHDASGGHLVWPITPDRRVPLSEATFSQHDGEADLHTDSQYRLMPERYFALLVVHAARDGGGTSLLLPAAAILEELSELPDGDADLVRLAEPVFPFEVPTVFTAAQRADVREYIRAPIIAHEPLIRYRHDTLSAGLAAFGEPTTSPHRGAVGRLHKLICSSSERLELRLGSGDLLLINNHELLHGRTAFRDPNRLLLRVRFTRELRTREEGRGASG